MKAYKGFDGDMRCRGFQYEEGKTYELPEGEEAKLCKSGFHACENPLDCWGYYDLVDSEYHEVELEEVSDERADDTKVCGRKITIGAKLDIRGMVKASVDFVLNSVVKGIKENVLNDNGGDGARIGSSGYGARIGSSGDGAQIGSSGHGARIGSSGDWAQIGSSGDWARINMQGTDSIGAAIGYDSIAKGAVGNWIVLAEWASKENNGWFPKCVKAGKIDGVALKADTWYKLEDSEFVEVVND